MIYINHLLILWGIKNTYGSTDIMGSCVSYMAFDHLTAEQKAQIGAQLEAYFDRYYTDKLSVIYFNIVHKRPQIIIDGHSFSIYDIPSSFVAEIFQKKSPRPFTLRPVYHGLELTFVHGLTANPLAPKSQPPSAE